MWQTLVDLHPRLAGGQEEGEALSLFVDVVVDEEYSYAGLAGRGSDAERAIGTNVVFSLCKIGGFHSHIPLFRRVLTHCSSRKGVVAEDNVLFNPLAACGWVDQRGDDERLFILLNCII